MRSNAEQNIACRFKRRAVCPRFHEDSLRLRKQINQIKTEFTERLETLLRLLQPCCMGFIMSKDNPFKCTHSSGLSQHVDRQRNCCIPLIRVSRLLRLLSIITECNSSGVCVCVYVLVFVKSPVASLAKCVHLRKKAIVSLGCNVIHNCICSWFLVYCTILDHRLIADGTQRIAETFTKMHTQVMTTICLMLKSNKSRERERVA